MEAEEHSPEYDELAQNLDQAVANVNKALGRQVSEAAVI